MMKNCLNRAILEKIMWLVAGSYIIVLLFLFLPQRKVPKKDQVGFFRLRVYDPPVDRKKLFLHSEIHLKYCKVHHFQSYEEDEQYEYFVCLKANDYRLVKICFFEEEINQEFTNDLEELQSSLEDVQVGKIIRRTLQTNSEMGFIDIGLDSGYFALMAATLGVPVVTVESRPKIVHKFLEAVYVNSLHDNSIILVKNTVLNARGFVNYNHGRLDVVPYSDKLDLKLFNASTNITSILLDDLLEVTPFHETFLYLNNLHHIGLTLSQSSKFFAKLNVRHVIVRWSDVSKRNMLELIFSQNSSKKFIVHFLRKLKFEPKTIFNVPLEENYEKWAEKYIYWKR